MADTTKKIADNAKKVQVKVPRLSGQNARQEAWFCINGKTYRLKRGVYVDIPEELAEVIRNGEKAEEYAMRYVDGLAKAEEDKKKEVLG